MYRIGARGCPAAAITIIVACTAFAGCTTGSQAIADPNKVAQIQPGKTNTKQVEDLLGKPEDDSLQANGEKVWTYQRVQQGWNAFDPGLNMAGDSMHEQNLTIRFDRNGVVKAVGAGEHKF
jgi:outer membrane protein assembly factor BamE (lipoprotein component of BamABCDE complex)